MMINARIDNVRLYYLITTRTGPRFTRYAPRAAAVPSANIDSVIRCLKLQLPTATFWREDEPEPDDPKGSAPRTGEPRRAPVEFQDPYPEQ